MRACEQASSSVGCVAVSVVCAVCSVTSNNLIKSEDCEMRIHTDAGSVLILMLQVAYVLIY